MAFFLSCCEARWLVIGRRRRHTLHCVFSGDLSLPCGGGLVKGPPLLVGYVAACLDLLDRA